MTQPGPPGAQDAPETAIIRLRPDEACSTSSALSATGLPRTTNAAEPKDSNTAKGLLPAEVSESLRHRLGSFGWLDWFFFSGEKKTDRLEPDLPHICVAFWHLAKPQLFHRAHPRNVAELLEKTSKKTGNILKTRMNQRLFSAPSPLPLVARNCGLPGCIRCCEVEEPEELRSSTLPRFIVRTQLSGANAAFGAMETISGIGCLCPACGRKGEPPRYLLYGGARSFAEPPNLQKVGSQWKQYFLQMGHVPSAGRLAGRTGTKDSPALRRSDRAS